MYTRILVSTDGSQLSDKAVLEAAKLARLAKAELVVLTVMQPWDQPQTGGEFVPGFLGVAKQLKKAARAESEKIASDAAELAGTQRVKATQVVVESFSPYKAIIATAKKEKCDLLVMASHGRSGASALLIGSETQKVLTHSKIPVLVLR